MRGFGRFALTDRPGFGCEEQRQDFLIRARSNERDALAE